MSYYVRFEVYWDGPKFDLFDKKACQEVFSRVEEYIRAEEAKGSDYPAIEWLDEFRKAFAGKGGDIKGLERRWAASLLRYISRCFPEVVFGARGIGEELDDVWVLWHRGGRRIKSPA